MHVQFSNQSRHGERSDIAHWTRAVTWRDFVAGKTSCVAHPREYTGKGCQISYQWKR